MKFQIEPRDGYLHAELRERQSAADMRVFLTAVKAACQEHGQPRILLSIRASDAVFRAEDYGLNGNLQGYVNSMVTPACRVALVGDSSELQHAHDYVVLVARQQHVNARSFRDVRAALRWLQSADVDVPVPGSNAFQPARSTKLP